LDEREFREKFRGSPILRSKRRGFLRNVAVALGNSESSAAVPALVGALQDKEPLVRGHVAWALGRIATEDALRALQARFTFETDAEVLAEIQAAITEAAARSSGTGDRGSGLNQNPDPRVA
jgi:epoxyqueuosine reductase